MDADGEIKAFLRNREKT